MQEKKTIYNIANALSISRIVAVIPLIICLENFSISKTYVYYSIFIIIYIVLSDLLDGYFARLSNCVTDFGKIIDPIADKVCFLVVLIYLIDTYPLGYFNPFIIFYILLCFRDVIILLFSVYNIVFKRACFSG